MIERGGGRTSGLTDWHRMDVNSMWACLQDHDTTNHWKQVAGWRKICDLAQTHLSRLQEYRRGLAEVWPPATNAAAHAYLARLDELIDKVRHTHDAAATNYTTLAAATQAISGTRASLQKIHQEYAAKLQQKQAYEAIAADPKAAMGSRVPDRPVTDADLEQLNVRARGIMYGLSSELQQAQVALRQPPPAPKVGRQLEDPDVYGFGPTPVIPAIATAPMAADRSTLSEPTAERGGTIVRPWGSQSPSAVGPVLGGVVGAPGLPTGSSAFSGLPPPTPSPTQFELGPSASFPATPSVVPKPPETPARKPGISRQGGQLLPGGSPPTQNRPLPHGGLIGGVPGMPVGQPPAARNNQPPRVGPIGGVIGGGGAGTAPTGSAGSRPGGGRAGYYPATIDKLPRGAPRRPYREDGHDQLRRWDPDHPWELDHGVAPVLRPPDEDGPIDPGPAIGFRR